MVHGELRQKWDQVPTRAARGGRASLSRAPLAWAAAQFANTTLQSQSAKWCRLQLRTRHYEWPGSVLARAKGARTVAPRESPARRIASKSGTTSIHFSHQCRRTRPRCSPRSSTTLPAPRPPRPAPPRTRPAVAAAGPRAAAPAQQMQAFRVHRPPAARRRAVADRPRFRRAPLARAARARSRRWAARWAPPAPEVSTRVA
jgi:hypothetical protein